MDRCARAAAVFVAAAAALWSACATPTERAYGLSQRDHVARMTENPAAGLEDLEVKKPDGDSTDAALIKYRERELDVDVEEPPSVIDIDIGG